MHPSAPYYQELGDGPSVVCLHASASTSSQWRALMQQLAPSFRVIAPDLYGCGQSASWNAERPMRLDDELDLLDAVFARAGPEFALIGHSYGGAIALKAALRHRQRLRALVLFEPVLFSLLLTDSPHCDASREILSLRSDTTLLIRQKAFAACSARFVDYWMGTGTWDATPRERQLVLAKSIPSIAPQWDAACEEPSTLHTFTAIATPTLLLTGTQTQAPAEAVSRLIAAALPRVRSVSIDGAGHLGPMTHPQVVNPLIESFVHDALHAGKSAQHRDARHIP